MSININNTLHQNIIKFYFHIFLIIACIYLFFSYLIGGRLTPTQAAKATEWINGSSILLGKYDSKTYKVYIYENDEEYRSVIVENKFPLWRSNTSFWANKTEDNVKLVGWCSYSDKEKQVTVVPVQNFDDNVAYIEMGTGINKQRKDVKLNEVVLFSWEKSLRWNDLNAIAYSSDNKALYKLGYEIVNSTIIHGLRWLPVNW